MAVLFLILIIPLILCIPFRRGHFLALRLNNVWAWAFFSLAFLPLKREWRFKLDKKKQYILCANHFSYLDIPSLGLFPKPFKFVGKSQLSKVPVFGFMYNNLHITVNRSSVRSRGMTLKKARAAIEGGFNLGFFPEGGIRVKDFPNMIDFQDGAFRLAAENDLAVVPITFLDNYNIFYDDEVFNMNRKTCRIIYHEPMKAADNSEEEIKKLKFAVQRVIQDELNAHHLSPKTEISA